MLLQLAMLILVQDQVDGNSYSNKELGFSMTLPGDGWEISTGDKARESYNKWCFVAFSHEKSFVYGFACRSEHKGTLTEYNSDLIMNFTGIELESTRKSKMDGKPAYHNVVFKEVKGVSYKYDYHTIDAGNGIKFRLLVWTDLDKYEENKGFMRQVAESARFGAPPAGNDKDRAFESNRWGFRYTVPAGWKNNELEKMEGIVATRFENADGSAAGLCGIEESEDTLEDYFSNVLQGLKDKDFKPQVHSKKVTGNTMTALYSLSMDSGDFYYHMRLISHKGKKYRIVFYCFDKEAKRFAADFEKLADTFDLLK
jgi:predicted Zn-dependent protease